MNNRKNLLTYYVGAFFLQLVAVGICIGLHRLFIHLGGQIQAPEPVSGEMTDPTVGRCLYVFIAGIAFLLLSTLASRSANKGKDFRAFALGIFAGIFLWQSIGEDAWHFSVGGTHFARLESIEVLPFFILFLLLLCTYAKRQLPNWGLWCALLSFATNWFGHYYLVGICPLFGSFVAKEVWIPCVSIGLGALLTAAGLLCGLVKSKDKKQWMLSAILTYHGVGVLLFGLMR